MSVLGPSRTKFTAPCPTCHHDTLWHSSRERCGPGWAGTFTTVYHIPCTCSPCTCTLCQPETP